MFKDILQKPEKYRNRMALGLTITLTVLIFTGFAFYNGYLNFGNDSIIAVQKFENQMASVTVADSPIQNTKNTFKAAFGEINKQYREFKDSLSAVLVPFITGIEVYERE